MRLRRKNEYRTVLLLGQRFVPTPLLNIADTDWS